MNHKPAKQLLDQIESSTNYQTPRMHLGASEIGTECVLSLWLGFRWVSKIQNSNKSLRLSERGNKEEKAFEELLTKAGCTLFTKDINTGEQFRIIDCDGHFGGSLDGVITGITDLLGQWCLVEFKTAGDKYFKELYGYNSKTKKYDLSLGKGVRLAQPKHYAQMQTYMHKKGLKHALYCSVNKNDDTLYFEIVDYDPSIIPELEERAKTAIYSKKAPKKISNNPSSFKCLFCKHKGVCQFKETPQVNCRSCEHIVMLTDGKWKCGLTDQPKDKEKLLNGCEQYELNSAIAAIK